MKRFDNKGSPLLVRDLMTVGVPTCAPDTKVIDLARIFIEKGYEAVIVLDKIDGHALGVISQENLIQAYHRHDVDSIIAEEVMQAEIPQVPPNIPAEAAAHLMHDQKIRALFLMHHSAGVSYPAAMITYIHMIRHLAATDLDDLRDLGIHAERKTPIQSFIERRDAARKLRGIN